MAAASADSGRTHRADLGRGAARTTACAAARPAATARATDTPHWTVATIEARIAEAVDTLKRVPAPDIQRTVTRWPEFVRDANEAYGYSPMRVRRAPAAADAITRLDETLDWLRWLPPVAQRIAWSRASGLSWRRIAAFVGKAPNTCRAWNLAALHYLAGRLNGVVVARSGDRANSP